MGLLDRGGPLRHGQNEDQINTIVLTEQNVFTVHNGTVVLLVKGNTAHGYGKLLYSYT